MALMPTKGNLKRCGRRTKPDEEASQVQHTIGLTFFCLERKKNKAASITTIPHNRTQENGGVLSGVEILAHYSKSRCYYMSPDWQTLFVMCLLSVGRGSLLETLPTIQVLSKERSSR